MKSYGVLFGLVFFSAMTAHAGAGPMRQGTYVPPKVYALTDTIFIPGGTLTKGENAGSLESTINGDTTADGARANPNRVYALSQGQVYYQQAPIFCNNPTGKLTISAVRSDTGTTKPIILIAPVAPATTVSNNGGTAVNVVYGSIKCDGIHYQAMQLTGSMPRELFVCGTSDARPQSLEINNCLFEFCNVDLFDCSNDEFGIGGWPSGARFRITNSYFRNLFHASQWWGSRIFQCRHPMDTLWIENCTVTTGGLTFYQGRQLTDFTYINHNTFVNNMKPWLFSPYHKTLFITNNIFINQNWVGESAVVTESGQDPDNEFLGTITIDTNNTTNGETVPAKYLIDATHFSPALDLNRMEVLVSDNIDFYDSLLVAGYYQSSVYTLPGLGALPSFTTWGTGPYPVRNVPCQWMNARTRALFNAYGAGHGGMFEMMNDTAGNPETRTPGIADASVVDSMAAWNQYQWGDPRFPRPAALENTGYIYGDYSPLTLPGIVGGVKTDNDTLDGAGISRFTDLAENFSQLKHISTIDNLPIGSLIWDDAQLEGYNSGAAAAQVYLRYLSLIGPWESVPTDRSGIPGTTVLAQNYPNPFNPETAISYQLSATSRVTLTVYDVLGREVATLVNEIQPPGRHVAQFDGTQLASGVYLYRLQVRDFTDVKKMILLR